MLSLKKFILSFVLSGFVITTSLSAQVQPNPAVTIKPGDTPPGSILIDHPAANDAATFFSTSTAYTIFIFKPGSKSDLEKIITSFKSDPSVESCMRGEKIAETQELKLHLKSTKDKMWFVTLFKNAGLNTIQINNNKFVEVDKM